MKEEEKYMPVKDFSKLKGIPISTVYKMIKDKNIKTKKIGTYTLVSV